MNINLRINTTNQPLFNNGAHKALGWWDSFELKKKRPQMNIVMKSKYSLTKEEITPFKQIHFLCIKLFICNISPSVLFRNNKFHLFGIHNNNLKYVFHENFISVSGISAKEHTESKRVKKNDNKGAMLGVQGWCDHGNW